MAMVAAGSSTLWRTTTETPLGPFTVFVSKAGVVHTRFEDDDESDGIEDEESHADENPRRTAATRREVDAYFGGKLRAFETPVESLDRSVVGEAIVVRLGHDPDEGLGCRFFQLSSGSRTKLEECLKMIASSELAAS